MFQARQPSSPVSLDPFECSTWSEIIRTVRGVSALVIEDANQDVIDHVNVIRTYADLSVMYPHSRAYRDRLSQSLVSLSETFREVGEVTFAAQLKALASRCQKFDCGIGSH